VISTGPGLGVLGTDGTLKVASLPGDAMPRDWIYLGFTNPSHGFAIMTNGDLLRSTDGGHTWQTVTYTG
jgi:photosystem II stability/assembly factor-like uncharacterized protein